MRTALVHLDCFFRADINACAAFAAIVIDERLVIFHLNRVHRTLIKAGSTAGAFGLIDNNTHDSQLLYGIP